jgi:aspartate 1-decarboxylase
MQLNFLKSKIHRATVSHSNLDYEGSIAIDEALLEASGIREFEQVDVYNINNGERLTTYAIKAERNSGIIGVQGAAAHKATQGDLIIICAYCVLDEQESKTFTPKKILVDSENKIAREF